MQDFKLPEVGENIASGTVVSISVSVGDTIKKDQDLLELETDKASLPVPSPYDGVIKEILIKEGQEVNIGDVIMKIETGAQAAESSGKPAKKEESKEKEQPQQKAPAAQAPKPQSAPAQTQAPVQTVQANAPIPAQRDVPAAPSVRRFAREIGITISQVPGSGPGGRISIDDVKAFSKNLNAGRVQLAQPQGPVQKPLPDFSKWGEVDKQPMSKIRKVTAEHLSFCWQTIPHVTQVGKADLTNIDALRKKMSTPEKKLTITPFLLKIMALALKEFPQFNSSIDMTTHEIIYKKFVHLGVAVDTDNGLLVPVVRDVDQKSVTQINDDVLDLAEKARTRKVSLEDLRGGGMTLTNLGGIFGTSFTPIVNWPEVAILGVSRGSYEQVYINKEFVPRLMLPLSLSYDHRIIDGADGARFLKWVCQAIEQPEEFII